MTMVETPWVDPYARSRYEREVHQLREAVETARRNVREAQTAGVYDAKEAADLIESINSYETGTLVMLRKVYAQ
jgi:hypothetical protein